MNKLVVRIRRKLLHFRLRPIRVFCFHQVSDEFEPETMKECDWMQSDVFKQTILALKQKYAFVSLADAYNHIANDKVRMKRYVVLTADDGCASLKNILPWLGEQSIPVTLFLNPLYFDGVHFREKETEKYLTNDEVREFVNSPGWSVFIASHGWSHKDCLKMSQAEFETDVKRSELALSTMARKVPFYAFTYGHYNKEHLLLLKSHSLIPVFVDGMKNYDDVSCIHRELLDSNSM